MNLNRHLDLGSIDRCEMGQHLVGDARSIGAYPMTLEGRRGMVTFGQPSAGD